MKVRLAGVGSVFLALSVARTAKRCEPSDSGAAGVWLAPGPEQGANGWVSRRHLKVEFDWFDENRNVGLRSAVELGGPEVIVVSGAVESSTYVNPLEHGEVFPAPSVAVARKTFVVSLPTPTGRPDEEKWPAKPTATAKPVQPTVL